MLGTNLGRGVAWQIKALKITAQHSAAIFMYIVDTRGNHYTLYNKEHGPMSNKIYCVKVTTIPG